MSVVLAERWLALDDDHDLTVLTDRQDLVTVRARAASLLSDRSIRIERTTAEKFDEAVIAQHAVALDEAITNDFGRARPAQAARTGPVVWQWFGLALLAVAIPALVAWNLGEWLVAVVVAALAGVGVLGLCAAITNGGPARAVDPPLPDEALPTYTVLVPAYREETVIGNMMRHIEALDYPRHLLDVIVLVERHDPDTRRAVLAADPPPHVRIAHVPPGTLQTKPRTCNLGLALARGELLVVFDAENRPEPDQLRRAAERFAAGGPDLACVQARLKVSNGRWNLLTRCFELEYATRWGLVAPGLVRMGLPIPLGGTSNHFRTALLRELGGWDAWNVTEDADLGMRCAAEGLGISMVDSVTWEESVTSLGSWHRQRVRWHKGMLITSMVHSRHPRRTWRSFRAGGVLILLSMVLGNPLAAILGPVSLAGAVLFATGVLPDPFHRLAAATVVVAIGTALTQLALNCYAGHRNGVDRPLLATVLVPVYWLIQFTAAVVAVVEAVRRPFHWSKTPHTGAASGEPR